MMAARWKERSLVHMMVVQRRVYGSVRMTVVVSRKVCGSDQSTVAQPLDLVLSKVQRMVEWKKELNWVTE